MTVEHHARIRSGRPLMSTWAELVCRVRKPIEMGQIIGQLMEPIPEYVSYHMNNTYKFQNLPKRGAIDTTEFTAWVDAILMTLRKKDSKTDPFCSCLAQNRKSKQSRRQYRDRYIRSIENLFGLWIADTLLPILMGFHTEANRQFNKGIDRERNKCAWRLYPCLNVALEANGEHWLEWLRVRCEDINRRPALDGRPSFVDV